MRRFRRARERGPVGTIRTTTQKIIFIGTEFTLDDIDDDDVCDGPNHRSDASDAV